MRHFIDEVALNLIPSSEALNKTLATILAILIHDCIFKEGFADLFIFHCMIRRIIRITERKTESKFLKSFKCLFCPSYCSVVHFQNLHKKIIFFTQ